MEKRWSVDCKVHDTLEGAVEGESDGAYALDELEHIPREDEERFMTPLKRGSPPANGGGTWPNRSIVR